MWKRRWLKIVYIINIQGYEFGRRKRLFLSRARARERMRTKTKCREFDKSFASHNSLLYFYNEEEKKVMNFIVVSLEAHFFKSLMM